MAVTINEGTAIDIYSKLNAGTEIQVVKLDIGSGTAISDFGGTITRVTDLLKGTITSVGTVVGAGTLTNVGTVKGIDNVTFGTFDTFYRHPDKFATVISTGTSVMGTVKAAVSGSAIYITDLVVSAGTATNVEIGDGGTSKPIIGTLHFATNGGAVVNFRTPVSTTAGSALVYKQSVNGPLTLTVTGYVD